MTLIQPWKRPNRPKGRCKALPVGKVIIFIIQSAVSKVSAWKFPPLPRIVQSNWLQKESHSEQVFYEGFSMSQAWLLVIKGKYVKWSRNSVTRAVADIRAPGGFSHIFPLPFPGRWWGSAFGWWKVSQEGYKASHHFCFLSCPQTPRTEIGHVPPWRL